jgi:hypothetical protein
VDGADDLAAVDALEVDAGDAEVGMPELALDHTEPNALVRHLDGVGVPQLMRCEPPPNASFGGRVVQLLARRGRLPTPARGRPVDHAQQCPNRQLAADPKPWVELLPSPTVHTDLASLAALPAPDKHSATGAVQVALLERERLADPQPGAPEQHDQRPEPMAVGAVTDITHYRDDLFNRRRVGGVLLALVSWRTASVVARHGRR